MTSENILFNMLIEFAKQFWWLILLIIGLKFLKLFMPLIKGKAGEGLVNLAAKLRLDPGVYHLIKDVTIPSKTGTTQIDHVIVSKFGLFVIETKNYKGWIFADAKDAKWTQVHFKQKHRFQNPLRQNYAHICALSELLDLPKDKIIGVVCFMGDAKFKNGVPEGVFLEGRYVTHIESFRTVLFSEDEVADLIQRIESGRLERGFKTNREHVKQLKEGLGLEAVGFRDSSGDNTPSKNDSAVHDSVTHPEPKACPSCGAAMVLRTAKKGANAGNQFWGCSTYPACKKIVEAVEGLNR
jgi:restriction system protein